VDGNGRASAAGERGLKLLVVIQARLGSTRLPGKVLLPLAGQPLLSRMVERVRAATTPFEVCVATTTRTEDDAIVDLCRRIGVECHRGHPTDLLDRHYQAAVAHRADAVAKIPSDCPLIDPGVIDRVLGAFLEDGEAHDLVTNLCPPTYPDGNDVEVMPMSVLAQAHREATKSWEREHTTPFIWDQPERFRVRNVTWETGQDFSATHRLTIDYPEDYRLIRTVYDLLWSPERPIFRLSEILEVLERPALRTINAELLGSTWQLRHLSDLRTVHMERGRLKWN
jgi:spore coat polysaccharide biosynthesis protein SpsF